MKVTRKSMFTGIERTRELDVTQEQLDRIARRDEKIQHIVPHLSEGDREFIMTGATDEEWDKFVPDE